MLLRLLFDTTIIFASHFSSAKLPLKPCIKGVILFTILISSHIVQMMVPKMLFRLHLKTSEINKLDEKGSFGRLCLDLRDSTGTVFWHKWLFSKRFSLSQIFMC